MRTLGGLKGAKATGVLSLSAMHRQGSFGAWHQNPNEVLCRLIPSLGLINPRGYFAAAVGRTPANNLEKLESSLPLRLGTNQQIRLLSEAGCRIQD